MPTELDKQIRRALDVLASKASHKAFDYEAYIRDFQKSAVQKAETVRGLLDSEKNPFRGRRPVLVSIGGGDGEEIVTLLNQTIARTGILIEKVGELANAARKKGASLSPKSLTVLEGDAQDRIERAIELAHQYVQKGEGDFVVVTCHAVLHELFDRSTKEFDPLQLFSVIFSNPGIGTWFTYREPGVPDKWPQTVLMSANCDPQSLLALAKEIMNRHESLRKLSPAPYVVGDHLRAHRTLGMEILAKLFYLRDLRHEIEERSTSIDHGKLSTLLYLAMGSKADRNNLTLSQPTDSFVDLWKGFGVAVFGLEESGSTYQLPIAESQTRLVAWRVARVDGKSPGTDLAGSELDLANSAINSKENTLLEDLIVSRARTWIESPHVEKAVDLLKGVRDRSPHDSLSHLWSNYVVSLAALFARQSISPAWFSEDYEAAARSYGIEKLYRSERMEFNRAAKLYDDALLIGNTLREYTNELGDSTASESPLRAYSDGVCLFLMGNLLRQGGLYAEAWKLVDRAEHQFRPDLPSHNTELAHCYYAKAVCVAVSGLSEFDAPMATSDAENTRLFATALITLTYSHAAWFVDDLPKAIQHAKESAEAFSRVGLRAYADRAMRVFDLLSCWKEGRIEPGAFSSSEMGRFVNVLQGTTSDGEWLQTAFPTLRASFAAGLLQFARRHKQVYEIALPIQLPRILTRRSDGSLEWKTGTIAKSLEEADHMLRGHLGVPFDRRIPLLAD